MKNRNLLTLLTLSLTIWAVGCAEAPTASIDAAKGRLAAVATEGNTYASDEYGTAEGMAAQLDAELETQAESFGLMRSYERASELIVSVETAVDAVESAIDAEKQRLRTETDQLATEAQQAVDTAREAITAIASEDLSEEQASAWNAALAGVQDSLAATTQLSTGDQLMGSRNEADSARASAAEVNTAITALAAELQRAREEDAARRARGDVTIPSAVLADGEELAAGTYRLRLAEDGPASSGTGPRGRWVEFVDGETVAGRGLAVVIPDGEIGEVSDSGSPRNEARVSVLKGGEYVRVWLNRDGVNSLVHLPPA